VLEVSTAARKRAITQSSLPGLCLWLLPLVRSST